MAKLKSTPKWEYIELDKSEIRTNPNNPKIKNEQGTERLEKLTKKFGVIFDGILNADKTLIDGHSRHEMYPTGVGRYFISTTQLDEKDYIEINALFDMAKAGDPDMFMIEQLLGEEVIDEYNTSESGEKGGKKDSDAKYPLVPQFDEKHEAIVILCSNSLDTTFIKNALKIGKQMSYKNKMVKETSVVTAKQFIDSWNAKK